jgi:phosphoribosylanthranilate isomerase
MLVRPPYIGVSGVETPEQVPELLQAHPKDSSHMLAIGGIVSYKTLIGVESSPILLTRTGASRIYQELRHHDPKNVLFALHYFTKPLDQVRPELRDVAEGVVTTSLSQQVGFLMDQFYQQHQRDSPNFQLGVQINLDWPDPREIDIIKAMYPALVLILQVSDFENIESMMGAYDVNNILLDSSRGRGVRFDMDKALQAYWVAHRHAKIGFAGGLSPHTVKKHVQTLIQGTATTDFSIDAQAKLRTDDRLDMGKVRRFLRAADQAFRED